MPGTRSLVCAALACLGTASAYAEEPRSRSVELTPYAAFRIGGSFDDETTSDDEFEIDDRAARGLVLDVSAATPNGYWEAFYGRQSTALETQPAFVEGPRLDIDVEYLHFGGAYVFDGRRARPFIGLSVGVTRFDPALPGFDGETFASGSFGGGIHLRADRRVGLRLEGRMLASLVDSDGELFCRSGPALNACAIVVDGELLVQWEARAGIVFRF